MAETKETCVSALSAALAPVAAKSCGGGHDCSGDDGPELHCSVLVSAPMGRRSLVNRSFALIRARYQGPLGGMKPTSGGWSCSPLWAAPARKRAALPSARAVRFPCVRRTRQVVAGHGWRVAHSLPTRTGGSTPAARRHRGRSLAWESSPRRGQRHHELSRGVRSGPRGLRRHPGDASER